MKLTQIPTIGPEEKFYGYIIGLGLEDGGSAIAGDVNLYAIFEYNNVRTVWIVPDAALFKALATHLVDNASELDGFDGGMYEKVWIEFSNGTWIVQQS